MSATFAKFSEAVGPVCLHLAERWRHAEELELSERRNLEMATMTALRWLSRGEPRDEAHFRQATLMLRREG
jgi:hypothetical protein